MIINDSHAINQKTKTNFKKRQAIFETILAPFNLVLGKNVFQKVNIQGNYAKKKKEKSSWLISKKRQKKKKKTILKEQQNIRNIRTKLFNISCYSTFKWIIFVVEVLKSRDKSPQEYFWDDPDFRYGAINKLFEKQLQRNPSLR